MRVSDKAKWLRAKRIFTFLLFVASMWAVGGLEGSGPIPHGGWLIVLLPALGFMAWDVTRQYPK